jgi:hypothetical protein
MTAEDNAHHLFPDTSTTVTPMRDASHLSQVINGNFNIGNHSDDDANAQYLKQRLKVAMVEGVTTKWQKSSKNILKSIQVSVYTTWSF